MSSRKDDERMKRKLGGNPAAVAFVSPFDSNNDSNSDNNKDNAVETTINNSNENNHNIDDDSNNEVNSNNEHDFNNNNASNNDIDNDSVVTNNNDDENNVRKEATVTSEYTDVGVLDELLDGGKRPVNNKVFKGFYLDPEIAKVLDKLAKQKGKGVQSQVVNEALKMIFIQKGLM